MEQYLSLGQVIDTMGMDQVAVAAGEYEIKHSACTRTYRITPDVCFNEDGMLVSAKNRRDVAVFSPDATGVRMMFKLVSKEEYYQGYDERQGKHI